MAWICDKNGQHRCEVKNISYNGVFMDVSSITATVESAEPISFAIGDYIEWDYDGLRYTLDAAAGVEKQARSGSVGNAFVYENLVFLSPINAAGNVDFLDVVLGNTNDFLTNTEFSFYGTAWDYAKRLEANLCRVNGSGSWKVRIWTGGTCYDNAPATGIDTGSWENKLVDVSGIKCLAGFQQIYELWGCAYVFSVDNGVNYVDFYDDFEQYAKAWKVGGVDKIFAYGKGNGLYKIRHTPDADHVLVTRLRAYGSGDNLPANYYLNSPDYHVDGNESSELAISRLMLPASQWTKGGAKGPVNAYLEQNTALYGVREASVCWDGSDPELGEIKPSIYGLTIQDLLDLMAAGTTYRPVPAKWPDTTQRIDKIITGAAPVDNGVAAEAGYDFTVVESSGSLSSRDMDTIRIYTDVDFSDIVMGSTPSVSHLAEYRIVPVSTNKTAVSFDVPASVMNSIESVNATLTPRVNGLRIDDATFPCAVTEESISNTVNGVLYKKRYTIQLLDSSGSPIVFSTMYAGEVTFLIQAHINLRSGVDVDRIDVVRKEYALSFNLLRGNKAIDKFFSVTIPQVGFDIAAAVTSGAKLCMRSGDNQPREFQIVPSSVRYLADSDTWYLRCKRTVDQSISTYFPNSDYVIAAGDEYYLTGIAMPSLYVEIAAQKLLEAATAWLARHSKPRMLSSVEVDNKIMAEEGIVLKEGMSLPLSDTDLGVTPQNQESRIIDNIRIEEGTNSIRTFTITLRDKKEKSSLDAAIRGATSNLATNSSVSEALSAMDSRDHGSLSGRDMPNQHPISSITGLEEALASIVFFELDGNGNVKLKDEYGGLWTKGWMADGGIGTDGGGGVGSSTLYGLNDVDIPVNPGTNDLLSYNGSVWVNVHKSDLLSGLATTQDLTSGLAGKQNAYPFTITGQSGQTYDLSNLGVTVDNKNAEIGTALTTLATVAGVDIKAKITHQDITGKADKVSGATNGHFAGLDSNGNLVDSGRSASEFVTALGVNGNFLTWYEGGNGYNITIPYANNAGVASALGSSTVGDQYTPIYLNGGLPYQVSGVLTNLLIEPKLASSTPTTLPLVNTTSANRLALLPADQIIIEKTTNGGSTWVDAGYTDAQKEAIFLGNAEYGGIQIPLINGVRNKQCGIRITITGMKYSVPSGTSETQKYNYWNSNYATESERYCSLSGFYFWVSSVTDGIRVKIYRAKGNASNTWEVASPDENLYLTGWSGGNYLRLDSPGVFGGGVGQVDNWWNYRIVLFTDGSNGGSLDGNYTDSAQAIHRISAYGESIWSSPNNLASINHLYTWDANKTAIFPAALSLSGSTKEARRIYFGSSSHYIELEEISTGNYAFHFSDAIYSDSWIADGGIGSGGGGGGSSTLRGLDDVDIPVNPGTNDLLSYNGSMWVNVSKSNFLSGYALISSLADVATSGSYNDLSNKPTALPNPQALTFGNDSYDGSQPKTITAASLGALTSHQSVTLASGTNNGTLKLTTAAGTVDNIAVTGLGSLAYKSSLVANDIPDLSGTYLKYIGWAENGSNFNNLLFGSWMYANSPTNSPANAGGGQLLSFGSAPTSYEYGQAQMAIGTTGIPFFRIRWENTWSAWREALVSGVDQTISGAKTFSNDMTLGGTLTLSGSTKKIAFGSFYIELQDLGSGNYALHTNAPFYSDQWIADGGIGSGSGGGSASVLNDLNDVTVTSPAQDNVLVYDYSLSHWVNVSKASFLSGYATTASLATVATSGSYNDLSNKPSIPDESTVSGWGFTKNAGTVTSVAMTLPTGLSVSGSPITSSGTLAVTFTNGYSIPTTAKQGNWDTAYSTVTGSQTKNKVFASPSTQSGAPSFRVLAAADIPELGAGKITSGTLDFDRLPALYIGRNAAAKNAGDVTLLGITGFTTASSASASGDTSLVVWEPNGGGTGVGVWHFKGNIVADGWIADGGIGSGSGGNAGTLAELNDVTLSSLANGDVLTYNSSSNHWVNTAGYVNAISVGSGNYITGVSKSGSTLTFTTATFPTIPSAPGTLITNNTTAQTASPGESLSGTINLHKIAKTGTFSDLLSIPTTVDGYGITDAVKTSGNQIISGIKNFTGTILASVIKEWDSQYPLTIGDTTSPTYIRFVQETAMYDVTLRGIQVVNGNPTQKWYISEGGSASFTSVSATSLSVNGTSVTPTNYVTLTDPQTISGVKTFSGGITLSSANIVPSADGANKIGNTGARFGEGHFSDLYASYFKFQYSSGGTITNVGQINFDSNCGDLTLLGTNSKDYAFYKDKFFVRENGTDSASVDLGASDHRWKRIYGIDGYLNGNLSLAQTSQITLGPVTITYDATNKALHISGTDNGQTIGIYCDGWIADGGIRQTT